MHAFPRSVHIVMALVARCSPCWVQALRTYHAPADHGWKSRRYSQQHFRDSSSVDSCRQMLQAQTRLDFLPRWRQSGVAVIPKSALEACRFPRCRRRVRSCAKLLKSHTPVIDVHGNRQDGPPTGRRVCESILWHSCMHLRTRVLQALTSSKPLGDHPTIGDDKQRHSQQQCDNPMSRRHYGQRLCYVTILQPTRVWYSPLTAVYTRIVIWCKHTSQTTAVILCFEWFRNYRLLRTCNVKWATILFVT